MKRKGRNFADPAAKARAIQAAVRNSFRLPVTLNNSINQVMAVSIASMRALDKQIKTLDKAIEQQFQIIPNTLTSVLGIGKVYFVGIIAEIGDINRFEGQASIAPSTQVLSGLNTSPMNLRLRILTSSSLETTTYATICCCQLREKMRLRV